MDTTSSSSAKASIAAVAAAAAATASLALWFRIAHSPTMHTTQFTRAFPGVATGDVELDATQSGAAPSHADGTTVPSAKDAVQTLANAYTSAADSAYALMFTTRIMNIDSRFLYEYNGGSYTVVLLQSYQ